MRFQPPLRQGLLLRRYKRFLADIKTSDGREMTIHCANTGAMTGCADPGSRVWYSTSPNGRRKYRHSLEIVEDAYGHLIGVNTARANGLVAEALSAGILPGFARTSTIRREVAVPGEGGRFDLLVDDVFVEVKSVTLRLADSGAFPDAVSVRATRHVDALARLARSRLGAALVFCVLHNGIDRVRPADEIDPDYGRALRRAADAGVRILALRCNVTVYGLAPMGLLPVCS